MSHHVILHQLQQNDFYSKINGMVYIAFEIWEYCINVGDSIWLWSVNRTSNTLFRITRPDFNAELDSWLHSFTPAINYYFKNHLNYQTEVKYNMFGPVHPWDRTRDRTGEQLRLAMAQNPYMKVMVQSGYFDGATTYFEAK